MSDLLPLHRTEVVIKATNVNPALRANPNYSQLYTPGGFLRTLVDFQSGEDANSGELTRRQQQFQVVTRGGLVGGGGGYKMKIPFFMLSWES